MRLSVLLLLLASLAANALLAWQVWASRHHEAPASVVVPQPHRDDSPPPPPRPLGEQLRTDDPAELTARLRDMAMPPELLNAVVADRLRRTLSERMQSLSNENSDGGYWTGAPNLRPDQLRAMIELQAGVEAQLRELLGDDYESDPVHIAELQRRYGPIDPAKLPRLEAILRDYQSLAASYTVTMFRLPGDEEAQTLLHQEQQADLAALLSPTELLEFNLRNGNPTSQLRTQLGVMQVTEAEFRQLLPLWQQMSAGNEPRRVWNPRDPSSPEELAARETLVAQASTFLGPERAAELVQALTPQAYTENVFAARLGLPVGTARSLYQLRTEATALLQDGGPPADASAARSERVARAQAMLDELKTSIGPENLELYRNVFGGWINGLENLTAPPASPPFDGG